MRLFQYYDAEDEICAGAVVDGKHLALPEGEKMSKLIKEKAGHIEKLVQAGVTRELDPETIRFAPVISKPDKILCIGLNYNDHINETGLANDTKPGFPPVFPKYSNALIGHGNDLALPEIATQFDYEAELVIVIGKKCKDVTKENAKKYIAGYTVGNDFSARDLQFKTSQWTLGKTCDGFAPVGPYFVSADELDPDNLKICSRVNGETKQSSTTANMIYSCTEIVSYLSQFITLRKGDLIFTGTPSGVILGKPEGEREWLKAGDVVEIEIEGIGVLENRLV